MKRFLPSGFIICAGFLGMAAAARNADEDVTKIRKKFDLREAVLRRFLKSRNCPAESYADVFVREADAHGLDWRLLPSLSIVESGGGKHAMGNNLFGWANGTTKFASISEAIHHVASALSVGRFYKGKSLDGKLATYNHRVDYKAMVTGIMEKISPVVQPEAAE